MHPDFVEPAKTAPPLRHRITAASPWIVAIASALLALARQDGVAPWRTMWAEDAALYLRDAWTHGLGSMLREHGGYLQLVPRLLALPLRWIPASHASVYCAVVGAAASGAVAGALFRLSRTVLARTGARVALALSLVLLPAMSGENLDNVTNIIWILLFVAAVALVVRSDDQLATGMRCALVGLAAASTALALVYLPLAGWVLHRRARGDRLAAAAYAAGLALQLAVVLGAAAQHPQAKPGLGRIAHAYSLRIAGSFVTGERWLPGLSIHLGPWLPILAVVVVSTLVGLAWRCSIPSARRLAAGSLALSFLTMAMPMVARDQEILPLDDPLTLFGSRYTVVPLLFLVAAIVLLLDAGHHVRVLTTVVVAWALVLAGVNLRLHNGRSDGPVWSAELRSARRTCASGDTAEVPITPPGFVVTLPCSRLR